MRLYGSGAYWTPRWIDCWLLAIGLLIGCGVSAESVATPTPLPTASHTPTIAISQTNAPESIVAATLPPPLISSESIRTVTSTLSPTHTPTPKSTLRPTKSPTSASTSTQTLTPTRTKRPTATPLIDRTCDKPGFPSYIRYELTDSRWPTPVPNPEPHFWLSDPLDINGGMRISTVYPYGYDAGKKVGLLLHVGIDVSSGFGRPILAPAAGTIVFARSDVEELHGWRCNWYGNFVTILHDEKLDGKPVYSLFGHVQNIKVEEGQRVEQGDIVAEVGDGGAALAQHLHMEVRVDDNRFTTTRNPLLWLKPIPGHGVVVGRLLNSTGRAWQGVTVHAIPKKGGVDKMATTWTYLGDPDNLSQSDEQYAENFVFGNLPRGEHTIYVEIDGKVYRQDVQVEGGRVTTVELITGKDRGATKTPAPLAPATTTPEAPATGVSPRAWSATATAEANR